MEKKSIKKFVLDFWVGFVVFYAVAVLIVFMCSGNIPIAIIVLFVWIFIWAIAFADHIANAAVDEYKENKRREEFPTTKDLNENTDKILKENLKGAHLGTRYCKGAIEKGSNDMNEPPIYAR